MSDGIIGMSFGLVPGGKGSVLSRGSADPTVNDLAQRASITGNQRSIVSLQYRALLEYKGTARLTII